MTMPTNDSNDSLDLEMDNFVSPNATNDAPSDDFLALDMDTPVATVPEAADFLAGSSDSVVVPEATATVAEGMAFLANTVDFQSIAMESYLPRATSGSLTEGSMAYVGFTSADGYVTALANGTKEPTTSQYLATLRNQYGFTADQIAALTVTRIQESALPVGTGIEHAPTGVDVFTARRIAAGMSATARVAPASTTATAPRPGGNDDQPLIAGFNGSIVVESITEKLHGLSLHFGPCQIARHTIARDVVIDLLTTNGFADCAPAIRSGNAQLRKVMNSLNSKMERDAREDDLRLRTWNVTEKDCKRQGMEWPANLDSRWIVGLLDATSDLGSMGSKELVVSLVKVAQDDGSTSFEIQFTGGTWRMQRAVTERFNALYGTSALNVTDLIAWYQRTLIEKFGAIRQGFKLLIVGTDGNQENMERAERFMQVLQGDDIYGPSPIMGRRLDCDKVTSRTGATWEAFCRNVGAGMVEDIRALGLEFAMALKMSQDRAREKESAKADATPESIELAVRRAVIGSDRENSAARGLLARLTALAGRARDSVSLIGRAHALAAINACETLRVAWVDKCHADSTASMMAEIELD